METINCLFQQPIFTRLIILLIIYKKAIYTKNKFLYNIGKTYNRADKYSDYSYKDFFIALINCFFLD